MNSTEHVALVGVLGRETKQRFTKSKKRSKNTGKSFWLLSTRITCRSKPLIISSCETDILIAPYLKGQKWPWTLSIAALEIPSRLHAVLMSEYTRYNDHFQKYGKLSCPQTNNIKSILHLDHFRLHKSTRLDRIWTFATDTPKPTNLRGSHTRRSFTKPVAFWSNNYFAWGLSGSPTR